MREISLNAKIEIYNWDELPDNYKLLAEEAKKSCSKAYAPYSGFRVGAAVLLDSGRIVTGNNQENGAYTAGMCAERTAINYAASQSPDDFPAIIAIVAYHCNALTAMPCTPCGECRQVMKEMEKRWGKKIRIVMVGAQEVWVCNGINTLLPLAFEL